jgi:predicted DCC family thiol-disulfide oxidoreductase YuxK
MALLAAASWAATGSWWWPLMLAGLAGVDAGARFSLDAVLLRRRSRAQVPAIPVAALAVLCAAGLWWSHAAGALALLLVIPAGVLDRLETALAARIAVADVIYDGRCSFCRASVDRLLVLDLLRRLEPMSSIDPNTRVAHPDLDLARLDRELVVYDGGRSFGGFDAFRVIARKTPALWAVWPVLYLPPVPQLGRVVYRAIAARRMNKACAINAEPPRRPTLA